MIFVGCYSIFNEAKNLASQKIVSIKTGVSISLYPPSNWRGEDYQKLAPSRELLNDYKNRKVTIFDYCKIYREETLAPLDPETVLTELKEMGSEVVLLCYEPPRDFCHRAIVSDWLSVAVKRHVPELVRPDFVYKRVGDPMIVASAKPKSKAEKIQDPEPPFNAGDETRWGTVISSGSWHTTFLDASGSKIMLHHELDLNLNYSRLDENRWYWT